MQDYYNINEVKYKELDYLGFPGYKIGSDGSLWSNKIDRSWKQLAPHRDKDGYSKIHLCKNSKLVFFFVHRLVLLAFIGPCPEGMECCHNDGDPQNNNLPNLRWDTHKNNNLDKIKHGRVGKSINKGERNSQAKLSEDEVKDIRLLASTGNFTHRKLASQFNISARSIGHIINRKRWKHIL